MGFVQWIWWRCSSYAQGYDVSGDTMELIASISPPVENAHSPGLGSVERLEEDRILINWGIFGVIEEVDFESNRYWSVEAPSNMCMSRDVTRYHYE